VFYGEVSNSAAAFRHTSVVQTGRMGQYHDCMAIETVDFDALNVQLKQEREKVDVSSHDFSSREIVRMLEDGELNIAPEYQRKYRWTDETASSFIESVFLGLPVPPIFVATNVGFQWEVVDGLQRISSLVYFMGDDQEQLLSIGKSGPLKLTGLKKLSQLNGITWADLPLDLRRYFGRQPIQVIALTDKSVQEVRFDLFERLNAGSLRLSPQEIRSCIYRGRINQFIERLSINPDLNSLLKLQEQNQSDATIAEQVLKFFAYKNDPKSFKGPVTTFLNDYMVKASTNFDEAKEEDLFVKSVEHLSAVCNGLPFKRLQTNITPLVQFEACLVAIGMILERGDVPKLPSSGWIEDAELVESSTKGSNTTVKLRSRIDRALVLFS
jgi:hypothetical protein